jgi:K+-sensing histidine kinase KdpD
VALHAHDAMTDGRGIQMRVLKGLKPIAASLGLMSAVTALLWQVNQTAASSHALVYIYLFPVTLIAALYNGRIAVLSTAMALVCADYFLQEPLYSLANDNPREYGDLVCFALLAVTAIKFIRELVRPRTSNFEARSP